VRIDRSYLTDAPGEDDRVRRGRSALDDVDTAAKDECKAAPDQDKPTEAAAADKPAKVANLGVPAETRSRGEVYADTRQTGESGWERHRKWDTTDTELARFKTERAGLRETSQKEADDYVEQRRATRPWLEMAERASPESRRIIVAIDQGSGHGHIRHEGWVTEEANMRRAAYLEDPAQLDPAKRLRGIDGLKPGAKRHICADIASRVADPDAFATAFARGAEHPDVRAAVSAPYNRDISPRPVELPIADLLGGDGHKFCTGWRLEPVGGSMDDARDNRRAWRAAKAQDRDPDVPEPTVRPVSTFEGGTMVFVIGDNKKSNGYEIVTMYCQPRDDVFPSR
jgi:hypothetical protein